MVNKDTVLQTLEDIGMISEDELSRAEPFCALTCREISERLRDISYETEPAVIMACASLAFYRYTLSQNVKGEDFSSFKAGDVTISRSASANAENAVRLRDEALSSCAQFLTDVDFAFKAVEI